jgi:uncharacterized protein
MKLLNFLPKEDKFNDMLQTLAEHAQAASHALHQLTDANTSAAPSQAEPLTQAIAQTKTAAKQVYNQLVTEVCTTFITPFDREDIQELGTAIYLIPKLIHKSNQRMRQHHLTCYNGDFSRFSAIIMRQSTVLLELMYGLQKGLKPTIIHEKSAILYELEDQGDETLGSLISSLFESDLPVRELLLRKDLYEMLEDVTDYYRDAAAVAMRVVLKHS